MRFSNLVVNAVALLTVGVSSWGKETDKVSESESETFENQPLRRSRSVIISMANVGVCRVRILQLWTLLLLAYIYILGLLFAGFVGFTECFLDGGCSRRRNC
jgi:hypothetical protein